MNGAGGHGMGRLAALCGLALGWGLAGCAGPPQPAPGQLLGYGTPGVDSYMPPEQAGSLADLQARCRGVPDAAAPAGTQSLEAACAQLRRTARNQPGSALVRQP